MSDLTREELDALADEIRPPRDKGKRKSHVEQNMTKCSADKCDREVTAKGLCTKHYRRMSRTGSLDTTRLMGDFWSKVKRGTPEECWPWLGFVKSSGHGLTSMSQVPMHTSRKAWILTHGHITDGLHVLHKCDNALCCNPGHLYLGTSTDNVVDTHTRRPFEERIAGTQSRKLSKVQLAELWKMRRGGALLKECAEKFNVHIGTVCRYITEVRKEKLEKNRAARMS